MAGEGYVSMSITPTAKERLARYAQAHDWTLSAALVRLVDAAEAAEAGAAR